MEYDIDFFIKKLSAIDSKEWCTGKVLDSSGRCCVFGHCGMRESPNEGWIPTEEAKELLKIFGGNLDVKSLNWSIVYDINDGANRNAIKYGDNPKTRIINKLKEIKLLNKVK